MADTGTHMCESKKSTAKFKYTTIVGTADTKKEPTESLQEAFKKYRKAKQKEVRQARRLRKRNELRKGNPQKMAALREKFLEQAMKYMGYPYARKYWPPDSPEYKSKLFLDCCGLVRQVMRDLSNDFGFWIGPWNQAYMYDTLPITVERERDMKPGDLVFISATYYNKKSKKQRHDMTHVEIWLGEGRKTLGARWNNGKVKIWDNYKFTAKSYYNETYHFKSIDTWLKGVCESHCKQHRWRKFKHNPTKKSIFAVDDDIEQDQDADEAAGDDDDNVENFLVRGSTFSDTDTHTKPVTSLPKTDSAPLLELSSSSIPDVSPSEEINFSMNTLQKEIKDVAAEDKGEMKLGGVEGNGDARCISRDENLVDLENRGLYLTDLLRTKEASKAVDTYNESKEYVDEEIAATSYTDDAEYNKTRDNEAMDGVLIGIESGTQTDFTNQDEVDGIVIQFTEEKEEKESSSDDLNSNARPKVEKEQDNASDVSGRPDPENDKNVHSVSDIDTENPVVVKIDKVSANKDNIARKTSELDPKNADLFKLAIKSPVPPADVLKSDTSTSGL